MNCFKAKAEKTYGGWHAVVRLPHRGKEIKISNDKGKPLIFKIEGDATKAATDSLLKFLNGDYRSWHDFSVDNAARQKAELLFKKQHSEGI